MDPSVMVTLAVIVVLAPFALMAVFNHGDVADSRGRRVSRRWRARFRGDN